MSINQAFNEMFTTRSAGTQVSSGFGGIFPWFGGDGKSTMATAKTSFTLSAFYNGVEQLSNDMAKLPKYVLKKDGDNRLKFTDHPVNYLISSRPNNLMNAFDFWKVIEVLCIIKGNAYAIIERNSKTGFPSQLHLCEDEDVEVRKFNNKLYYKIHGKVYASADILHFKGFSFDGVIGVGVVTFAAQNLGVALDAQSYQQDVYKDRGLGYGVIESEKDVNGVNKKLIEDGFSSKMSSKNKFKVPMLDAGMKYKSISVSPAEAQFLETSKNGVLEVARWLNIAPHKLKDLSQGNFSNIYQQSIEHVQDSILPRVISKEQEINNKLFSAMDVDVVYCKFNIAVLLRGDLQMKSQYYTSAIYSGYMTRNEVRALEDMNPIAGLEEPLQPVNMQALSMILDNYKNSEDDKDKTK